MRSEYKVGICIGLLSALLTMGTVFFPTGIKALEKATETGGINREWEAYWRLFGLD